MAYIVILFSTSGNTLQDVSACLQCRQRARVKCGVPGKVGKSKVWGITVRGKSAG